MVFKRKNIHFNIFHLKASSVRLNFFTCFYIIFFIIKSLWRPNGHPALEIFLSKVEKSLFDIFKKQQAYSNFNSEE